jgi:hypothetical protein
MFPAIAAVIMVSTNSLTDGPGYAWTNAFRTIQGAIDASKANDTILVTNGVYREGGRTYSTHGLMNRVMFPHTLTLRAVSTNPADTVIVGAADPDTGGLGPKAVRGIQIGHNGSGNTITGFTITNGYTFATGVAYHEDSGGGIKGSVDSRVVVSNCVIVDCHAGNYGGGGAYLTIHASDVRNCSAKIGGGLMTAIAGAGTRIFSNTSTQTEGGVRAGTYTACVISNNLAMTTSGGGGGNANFFDCLIAGNQATTHSGALSPDCSATRCVIRDNRAEQYGGVSYGDAPAGDAYVNCLITGNSAGYSGGISFGTFTFVNCTMVGNTCDGSTNQTYRGVGGCRYSFTTLTKSITATNCIIAGNTDADGENNYLNAVRLSHCLTWPDPTGQTYDHGGNRTGNPKFTGVGDYHLQRRSPAIDTGMLLAAITTDLELKDRPADGNGNGTAEFDIGCYEADWLIPGGTLILVH